MPCGCAYKENGCALATLAVHIEEYRKVAPQLVIFQESIQGVENLKARVEELEAKLKAAGQIRDTSDLLVRDILNDPIFERLIMQKIAEQGGQLCAKTRPAVKWLTQKSISSKVYPNNPFFPCFPNTAKLKLEWNFCLCFL